MVAGPLSTRWIEQFLPRWCNTKRAVQPQSGARIAAEKTSAEKLFKFFFGDQMFLFKQDNKLQPKNMTH